MIFEFRNQYLSPGTLILPKLSDSILDAIRDILYHYITYFLINIMNVLIIGATFGIGYELAKKYLNTCDNLILLGRTQSKLEEIKQEFFSGKAKVYTENLDVTILDDCKNKCPIL